MHKDIQYEERKRLVIKEKDSIESLPFGFVYGETVKEVKHNETIK